MTSTFRSRVSAFQVTRRNLGVTRCSTEGSKSECRHIAARRLDQNFSSLRTHELIGAIDHDEETGQEREQVQSRQQVSKSNRQNAHKKEVKGR